MSNKYLIDNLKDVLAGIRKRIAKIEQSRDDYANSKRYNELCKKEQHICEIIKKQKEKQDVQSVKD